MVTKPAAAHFLAALIIAAEKQAALGLVTVERNACAATHKIREEWQQRMAPDIISEITYVI